MRSVTACRIEALEAAHSDALLKLQVQLSKAEARNQALEQRAAKQVLATHGRLDEALKLSGERLSQRQTLEAALEEAQKERAEALEKCASASADAERASQALHALRAENRRIKQELAERDMRTAASARGQAEAAAAHALEHERAAREAAENELQELRTQLRELQARETLSKTTLPTITQSLLAAVKVTGKTTAGRVEAEIDAEMEAAEARALR